MAWHLAWALATGGTAAALAWQGRLGPGPELAALGAGLVAALAGAALAASGQERGRAAVLVWGLAGAVSGLMTGGVLGPLAAWSLAPLAAAAAFRSPDVLPLGAAASLAAAIGAALGALLMPLPEPPREVAVWLGLLSLATVALGLGAGLVALHGEARRDAKGRDRAEARMLELLESQPLLLLALNPGGRILETYGQPPLGRPSRALVDGDLGELVAPDDRPAMAEALQRAVSVGVAEVSFRPAHDPEGWWELSLRRMGSNRIAAAVRDARAQHARETALERARAVAEQQNAGKSRFLANMSHELRTPLNAIMGFSDIMRQRLFGPVSDRYAEYAELIHESGAHLLELINDVLDMSKIEADRFELAREGFDAREAISAALRLMRGQADRAGVSLRGVLPASPLEAVADRRAVKQIAINLISNALKFTPRGGSVTLTLQAAEEMLEVIVADTGVGIAPDDLERLGRPFEQAGDADQKAGGSGLGLSLVRAFAQLHGGEMSIESVLGEGATVIVRMPVLAARPAATEAEPAQRSAEAARA